MTKLLSAGLLLFCLTSFAQYRPNRFDTNNDTVASNAVATIANASVATTTNRFVLTNDTRALNLTNHGNVFYGLFHGVADLETLVAGGNFLADSTGIYHPGGAKLSGSDNTMFWPNGSLMFSNNVFLPTNSLAISTGVAARVPTNQFAAAGSPVGISTNSTYANNATNTQSGANIDSALAGKAGTNVASESVTGLLHSNLVASITDPPNEYFSSASWVPIADLEGEYGPSGSFTDSETNIIARIKIMQTNGMLAAGLNWYQLSDIWATKISGRVVANPNTFPNGLRYISDYARSNGFKIMLYVGLDAQTAAGNAGYNGDYVTAAWDCATNFNVDGVFIDASSSQYVTENFLRELHKTGKKFYIHTPSTFATNAPNWMPWLNNFVNSWYPGYPGIADPVAPNNFTNFFQHLLPQIYASGPTRPGHFMRGAANLSGANDALTRMELESAAALSSVWTHKGPNSSSYQFQYYTNRNFLNLWRDPLVRSATILRFSVANSLTNAVLTKPLWPEGGSNAIAWAFWQNTNATDQTFTITNSELNFQSPVMTYFSPWSGAIEGWATNSITLHSVWGTNATSPSSLLYKVMEGFVAPAFNIGTNYLSDWNWRLNATNPPTKDMRANGQALTINSTTYAKGFCSGNGLGLSSTWEIPLGGVCNALYLSFGKQQAWDGGTSATRLTIWTNSVQAFQSGWVTNNSTQATNISLALAGVNAIRFLAETNGVTCEAALGDCIVIVPGTYNGTFTGNGSGLTNIPLASMTGTLTNPIASTSVSGNMAGLTNSGTMPSPANNGTNGPASLANVGALIAAIPYQPANSALSNLTVNLALTNNNAGAVTLNNTLTLTNNTESDIFIPTGTNLTAQISGTNALGVRLTNNVEVGNFVTGDLLLLKNWLQQGVLKITTNGTVTLGTNGQAVFAPSGVTLTLSGGIAAGNDSSCAGFFSLGSGQNLVFVSRGTIFWNQSGGMNISDSSLQGSPVVFFGASGVRNGGFWSTNPAIATVNGTVPAIKIMSANTNTADLIVTGQGTFTNGIASYASNTLAPSSITFPASGENWTNTTGRNITVFIDATGVTGTALSINGGQIYSTLVADMPPIPLQPNDRFSATYSLGSPTATIKPQ